MRELERASIAGELRSRRMEEAMDETVVQFPKPEEPPELLIGPFQTWKVQVEGRIIPRLTGFPEGDLIWLVVDGRFSAGFSKEYAHQAASLIAHALAVGEGFASLSATTKDRGFAPIGVRLGSLDDVK